MADTILLIGPVRSGKSTIGKLLADRLGRENVSLDDHYSRYRERVLGEIGEAGKAAAGLDDTYRELWEEAGEWGARWRAEMPVSARVLELFLPDHPGAVVDLGAGHSVYDPPLLARVSRLLEPLPDVVLLLPDPDPDASIAILHERLEYDLHVALNPAFVRHPANRTLAKHVVYTEGRTARETCDGILERIRG